MFVVEKQDFSGFEMAGIVTMRIMGNSVPNGKNLTVQIDIDETITALPEFFSAITKGLRQAGHRVIVVSSRVDEGDCRKKSLEELREYGIEFQALHLCPKPEHLDVLRIPDDLHPAHKIYIGKLFVAEDEKVDVLIDDCGITSELFGKYLPHVRILKVMPPSRIQREPRAVDKPD